MRKRPLVAVAYGPRSVPAMALAQAAAECCDLVWLVDARLPEVRQTSRLLRRFGQVVDVGGLDRRAVVGAVAPLQPDGMVTYFDAGMVDLAHLAADLEVPFFSPATAEALVDKARQREVLRAGGLEVPRSWTVGLGSAAEGLAEIQDEVAWPAVIKPRSESGSHHTFLARSATEAAALLDGLGDDREVMVIEDYLPGEPGAGGAFADYLSVESVVSRGEVNHVALTGRFPPAETFRETGFFIPAVLSDDRTHAVLDLTEAALRALGVEVGCLHTEIKFTPQGPRLIEVNGRLGGGIPNMLERAAGIRLLTQSLRVALGEALGAGRPVSCEQVGFRFFLQPPPIIATVTAIDGIETIADHPGVDSVSVHRGPGSVVDWRDGTRTFILEVSGTAADHAGVLATYCALHRDVTVHYEETGS